MCYKGESLFNSNFVFLHSSIRRVSFRLARLLCAWKQYRKYDKFRQFGLYLLIFACYFFSFPPELIFLN